jgi:two-component system, chemotaxis family, chemotaxis protein CheY
MDRSNKMASKKILSLGQCAADHAAISALLRRHFDAEVDDVDTFEDAESRLHDGNYDLVLVNRVLDRGGDSGVHFIAQVLAEPALCRPPVMLVSNYPDAQEQAVKLGAMPGFGKSALGAAATLTRLRRALGDRGSDESSE